ncbi:Nucleoporin [Tolypocladium paradoxum]|uniref:Nucleoporin n=1 Tax=Tolypocladium paradoxum TaxID=94208 RepID=A0A2S4L8I7_9HYPO|nr:Nucleoporin [Tolypocladium paradoxum]
MAEITTLDALQAFHRELAALDGGYGDGVESLDNEFLVQTFEREMGKLWECPPKNEQSRNTVKSGKLSLDGNEYNINEKFQQDALLLSDEIDIDELDAARCLLDSQDDPSVLGRSLLECGIIRFHQQRKYLLDALRLLLELDGADEETEESSALEGIKMFVAARLFQSGTGGSKRYVPRCMAAMAKIRMWLQKLGDKIAAAQTLNQENAGGMSEEMETVEFSRLSLIQQHEQLGVILCRCIEKRQAEISDFLDFISILKKADKYDTLLVHLVPAIGAYISAFGSTEGGYDLIRVRELNNKLFPHADDSTWPLPHLHAALRAWWLAEYSGFYLDDPPEAAIPPNTDLDEEDRQRSKQFLDSLKDGAFDFILSVAGDVKPPDWHDSVRVGMRNWLQRKSSALPSESIHFSGFFQLCLMAQLEVFVDAFISNLPDVLRKLRVEEDEQRQLSQAHEQDLDLERFLLIIAYSYEGRPDAAANFWSDPDSNLAGFMHWASRRASTPLVTAFCEMLQAISESDECATAAHDFLLDEGHHSSGKIRRSQSLTWTQIFKELEFFSDKIKQKPTATQTVRYRGAKPTNDLLETEPESAMMLECYLRLITKLAGESETARVFLLQNPGYNLVDLLYELASSPIPPRLRGCVFMALKALMARKSMQESHAMWTCLESWITGGYAGPATGPLRQTQPAPLVSTERILDEMSSGFEDPESFIQLLLALVSPARDSSPLNDSLPFPETLGSSSRYPGVEVYVDFVMGLVFANKSQELQEKHQIRVLRLTCLEFILTCLATFNEDLIVIANQTNIMIDSIVSTTDLAAYVSKHPFARVMEWMFNDKVMTALFNTIHQEPADVGNAPPDSPLILGILRAVEVISKVLDLEGTYLDLVRPLIKRQSSQRRQPVANAAYASFQDGLVTRLNLVVDLGNYCGIGHPDLTLACLKLLEKMASSSKITATWSGSSRHAHRNKAIVALEANGEHESISRSFGSELMAPLEAQREANSPNYMTKIYILDFLLQCLETTPKEPTIAHLLLGFQCGVDSLSIDNNGSFAARTSLFHSLVRLLFEVPSGDAQGMRHWLIALKARVMRILHILWSSSLSAPLVINELRENEFLFHLMIRESVIQPDLPWEGQNVAAVHFPMTDGAPTLVDYLTLRSLTLEYIAVELCMISQGRMPSVKRRIYDALNGQVMGDGNQLIQTPTIFDLYDFLLPDDIWDMPPPAIQYYKDLDLSVCLESDADSNQVYNGDRVKEILLLKRSEQQGQGTVIAAQDLAVIEKEEAMILEYLVSSNRQKQIATQCLKVLKSWTRLLLVMVECNDFKGTAQTSFFLQALQATLPSLEAFAADRPDEALELARLARVLLSKLDLAATNGGDKQSQAIGNLVSDKLYQLFQICLQAIGKWAGSPVLRSVYYEICYRYLTGMTEQGPLSSSRPKITKTIQVYGERLINAICDDAFCGDPTCQAAALVLLNALVNVGRQDGDNHVVETLNRLNFIGILVDSLRNIMQEWHDVFASGHADQQNHQNARLALLLQMAQSRTGAKYILYANLFHTIETSGLFSADPELQTDPKNPRALEQHYDLLAKITRIIGAALLSRGSHNIVQGRKFLTEHRMLVTHTLKRSAGIGSGHANEGLEERIGELADALMVVIAATGFLEFENESVLESTKPNHALFH